MIKKVASGRWQARIFSKGLQIATKTFDTKREATAWENDQYAELRGNIWNDPRAGDIPLADVVAQYLDTTDGIANPITWDTNEYLLRHIPAGLGRQAIGSITVAKLNALWVLKLKSGLARGTVARFRDSVASVFTFAVSSGYLASSPVRASKLPPDPGLTSRGVRAIEPDEQPLFLGRVRAKHPWYADLIEFLMLTGLRRGEAVDLRVRSYSLSFRGSS